MTSTVTYRADDVHRMITLLKAAKGERMSFPHVGRSHTQTRASRRQDRLCHGDGRSVFLRLSLEA